MALKEEVIMISERFVQCQPTRGHVGDVGLSRAAFFYHEFAKPRAQHMSIRALVSNACVACHAASLEAIVSTPQTSQWCSTGC